MWLDIHNFNVTTTAFLRAPLILQLMLLANLAGEGFLSELFGAKVCVDQSRILDVAWLAHLFELGQRLLILLTRSRRCFRQPQGLVLQNRAHRSFIDILRLDLDA